MPVYSRTLSLRNQHPSRWITLAAALCLLLTVSGCSWLRQEFHEPDVRVKAFQRMPGSNLLDQRFALLLEVTNPNDRELAVKGIRFTFDVEGNELMRGVSGNIPLIPAYGTVNFTVQGSANLVQAVKLIRKMQKHPDNAVNYTLRMDVDMAKGWPSTFHLNRDGEFAFRDWLGKR